MIYRVMHVSPPPGLRDVDEEEQSVSPISLIKNVTNSNSNSSDALQNTKSLVVDTGEFILRAQKRYNKRLQVTVVGDGGKEFKSFTHDVSVGGMNIVDSLPDWVVGYFKVRISKPGSKQLIELTCCLIENQIPGEKFRIAILPLESIDDEKNLETWLAA